ncbi:MAG: hypothetical protein RPR98_00850 [Bermanella sp.]
MAEAGSMRSLNIGATERELRVEQESYRLRGGDCKQDIVLRLAQEISKLEDQLKRLQVERAPHRFSLMKTYKAMIASRQELLTQLDG